MAKKAQLSAQLVLDKRIKNLPQVRRQLRHAFRFQDVQVRLQSRQLERDLRRVRTQAIQTREAVRSIGQGGTGRGLGRLGNQFTQTTRAAQSFAQQIHLASRRFVAFQIQSVLTVAALAAVRRGLTSAIQLQGQFVNLGQVLGKPLSSNAVQAVSQQIFSSSTRLGSDIENVTTGIGTLAQGGITNLTPFIDLFSKLSLNKQIDDIRELGKASIVLKNIYNKETAADIEKTFENILFAAKKTNVSVGDLIASTSILGNSFKSLGSDEIELFATVSTVVDQSGRSATEVSRALQTMLARLSAGSQIINKFEARGISLFDKNNNSIGFTDTIKQLDQLLRGADDRERAGLLRTLGGTRRFNIATAVVASIEKNEKLQKQLRSGAGIGGIDQDVKIAADAVEVSLRKIRNEWKSTFNDIVNSNEMKDAISDISLLSKEILKLLATLRLPVQSDVGVAAVIGSIGIGSVLGRVSPRLGGFGIGLAGNELSNGRRLRNEQKIGRNEALKPGSGFGSLSPLEHATPGAIQSGSLATGAAFAFGLNPLTAIVLGATVAFNSLIESVETTRKTFATQQFDFHLARGDFRTSERIARKESQRRTDGPKTFKDFLFSGKSFKKFADDEFKAKQKQLQIRNLQIEDSRKAQSQALAAKFAREQNAKSIKNLTAAYQAIEREAKQLAASIKASAGLVVALQNRKIATANEVVNAKTQAEQLQLQRKAANGTLTLQDIHASKREQAARLSGDFRPGKIARRISIASSGANAARARLARSQDGSGDAVRATRQLALFTDDLTRAKSAMALLADSTLAVSLLQRQLADLQSRELTRKNLTLGLLSATPKQAAEQLRDIIAFQQAQRGGGFDALPDDLAKQRAIRGAQLLGNLKVNGSDQTANELIGKFAQNTITGRAIAAITNGPQDQADIGIKKKQIEQEQVAAVEAQKLLAAAIQTTLPDTTNRLEKAFQNFSNDIKKLEQLNLQKSPIGAGIEQINNGVGAVKRDGAGEQLVRHEIQGSIQPVSIQINGMEGLNGLTEMVQKQVTEVVNNALHQSINIDVAAG